MYRCFFYAITLLFLEFTAINMHGFSSFSDTRGRGKGYLPFRTVSAPFTLPPVNYKTGIKINTSLHYNAIIVAATDTRPIFLKQPIVKIENPPLAITIKHVKEIEGCSRSTAGRKIKTVWDSLGKKKHQKITVEEYATYFGYDIKIILNRLV